MKKTLCMILAFLLVMCSMSAVITSYADDSVNLLADATHENGDVTWTTTTNVDNRVGNIDARSGDILDNKSYSVNGGYSWTFGLGDGKVGGDNTYTEDKYKETYAYVYIKANGLNIGDKYEFSYYYQNDYSMELVSIKAEGGSTANFSTPSTANGSKEASYKVSTIFTAPANGNYVITLKTNRTMHLAGRGWSDVILSDLSLVKTEAVVNLLAGATYMGGDVTWTNNADAWGDISGVSSRDNTERSVNGGYSWTFGMGNTAVGLPTNANPAYIYVKAKGLTAGARYDLSFIYQGDYAMALESIADGSGTKVEPTVASTDVAISGGDNAHQVITGFMAPTEGDYTITIKTNRDMHLPGRGWNNVILSDLVLSENTEPEKVTAEVLVSGSGNALVSNKTPSKGEEVTFTAIPYPDEEFLGWYNGDEKVSDQSVFKVVVNEAITLTAKFTSNFLNVMAGKKASDWEGYRWATIADSDVSRNGGQGYLATDVMWQSVYTKVTLNPNTDYRFSFNWKAVENSACPAYPAEIKVYSADEVDINDRYNNWSDHGESGLFQPQGGVDLEFNGTYGSEELAKTYEWQNLETAFTTTGGTDYYVIIYFSINGAANAQSVNLSDFILRTTNREIPSISDKNASDWSCFEWSQIEDSNVSRYGGKGYHVKEAMWQNIFTSVELKPNTRYSFSFEWKSVDSAQGPAYPNDIFVVAKNDIDMWDTTNPSIWDPANGFQSGGYDLEKGGVIDNFEAAKTFEWQNTTVNFTTKDQTDYSLLIHFQAAGHGHQELYLSDLKIEELGPIVPDDDDDDDDDDVVGGENLAANYTHANNHVTWDTVADAWGGDNQDNKANSVYGGFSWSFGLANSDYEKNPSYVTIKTGDLEANRKYEFSYIYQADYIIDLDSIDSDVEIVKEEDVKLLEGDRAHRITIHFTTSKAGPHTIKLKMGKFRNNEGCSWSRTILSDLGLYDITDRIYGSVKSELGGTVSGFDALYCTKGDEITLTATPNAGNTFIGWFDAQGNKVSSDAVYTFTAEKDFNLLAKFSGSNLPNAEWLTEHGMDGTFENGTMTGWRAEDRDAWDDSSWAMFERVNEMSYNGDYSLRLRARWRTSIFKFNDLKMHTKYHLSFYVNHPDLLELEIDEETGMPINDQAVIQWFNVTSGGVPLYSEAGSLTAPAIKGGTGWHKVNICFTTGERTDADFELYYTNINQSEKDLNYNEYIYMDDISLVEYTSNSFTNGDFEDGATAWRGEFSEENGTGKGTNFYQNVNVGAETLNTVTFKAKGKGLGGVSEIIAKDFNSADYLSSQSVVEINSDDWETYTFDFYSSVNPDVSLFFKASEGEVLVDDIVITKAEDRGNAVLEKIDFESDRFATHVPSDVFEIYSGSNGDANVHSGTKSLRFNSAKAEKDVLYLLQDAFGSIQVPAKFNYKLSLYYKTTKGNTLYLAPEYLPDDSVKSEYTAADNGWTKVEFVFSKTIASHLKVAIGNVIGKTNADFYIDDITITVLPPMVIETNSENKYCEWPLNILNNQGFEDKFTKDDWANMPNTTELRTDKGFAGDNYLRIKAGTYYVMPVKTDPSETYYFSVSSRLGKNSSGYIAAAIDSEGKNLYTDIDGKPMSKIVVDSTKWSRDSFLFSTSEAGVVYLVFAVDKGYVDIDEIALYKRQYGMDIDPNDHTKFVPYNYDNPDPSTVVLNGGDPTFSGKEQYLGESPETGDTRTAPATILVITTFAAMALILTAKRTRKISKGGKA